MRRAAFFFVPFIIFLCGCQQAAWKAGASADDLQRDELACQKQARNNDEITQCLRDKGWSLANFKSDSEEDPPADNGTPTPAPLTEAVRSQPSTPTNPSVTNSTISTTNTEKPATKIDPLQRQSVQTWWKAGAQAADFQLDANQCLAQLGERHAPDYAKHLYTKGMVSCLRERGWYAGRDPVYTPLR